MNMLIAVLVSFLAGAILGYIFFWGLWKTVRLMPHFKHPYLWIFTSFLIRTAIVLLGLYILLQVQWQLIAVALVGFIFARIAVMRFTVDKSNIIT